RGRGPRPARCRPGRSRGAQAAARHRGSGGPVPRDDPRRAGHQGAPPGHRGRGRAVGSPALPDPRRAALRPGDHAGAGPEAPTCSSTRARSAPSGWVRRRWAAAAVLLAAVLALLATAWWPRLRGTGGSPHYARTTPQVLAAELAGVDAV